MISKDIPNSNCGIEVIKPQEEKTELHNKSGYTLCAQLKLLLTWLSLDLHIISVLVAWGGSAIFKVLLIIDVSQICVPSCAIYFTIVQFLPRNTSYDCVSTYKQSYNIVIVYLHNNRFSVHPCVLPVWYRIHLCILPSSPAAMGRIIWVCPYDPAAGENIGIFWRCLNLKFC